jgi:hypothetical protein
MFHINSKQVPLLLKQCPTPNIWSPSTRITKTQTLKTPISYRKTPCDAECDERSLNPTPTGYATFKSQENILFDPE